MNERIWLRRYAFVLALIALIAVAGLIFAPRTEAAKVRTGLATWYDDGPGLYAAAGPGLRIGDWRGRRVSVCSDGQCVTVQLTDWCACGDRHGQPTLLDLSADAFRRLAPLSRGVIAVSVLTDTDGPVSTLPPTDTE
jgi:rare lipoprotein A (peptidoglycan hydrolase)